MLLISGTLSLEFAVFLFAVVQCKGPPSIMGTVKPQYTVMEGQTVKLWCNVSGTKNSPESRTLTAWRKLPEGHYITDKFARFKMRIGRYLRIKKVEPADKGTYVCIAENPYGKITREIRLVVQASKSHITTAMVDANSENSPTAAIGFTAREPTATRTSKLPTPKDGHPPKFRNPFNRSSEYTQGSPIKLKCHAYGEPPLNVTWLKNGKRLGKADRRHLKSKGWVLNFRELSPTDTGFYTCTATNTFGSVVKTFDIKVVDRRVGRPEHEPPILENDLKNETAKPGEDASFVCSAISRGYPKFHFLKWKSSRNVSNGSDPFDFVDFKKSKFREIREVAKPHTGRRQVYTHRLIIHNVTLADEAKYTCVVGNSAGWVSKHAFLTVRGKDDGDDESDGGTEEHSTTTKAPKNRKAQPDKEILVEEVPLAALVGVPIAVVILLIGTIVWCYFMTRKHQLRHQWRSKQKEESSPHQEKNSLSQQLYPQRKGETRNVSFNVYVDCPHDRVQSPTTGQLSQMYEKCVLQIEQDPPLDGLIVLKEPPRTHSNRTNHRKQHEREGFEFSESNGSEMKCSGV